MFPREYFHQEPIFAVLSLKTFFENFSLFAIHIFLLKNTCLHLNKIQDLSKYDQPRETLEKLRKNMGPGRTREKIIENGSRTKQNH
jgi:hypothetical protein